MLRAVSISDGAGLRALSRFWEELVSRSRHGELNQHPRWLLPWWDVFGGVGGRVLRSLAFFAGKQLVGFAPLVARRHRYRPGIPFRRLELLGSGEDESDETCGDYLGIIAEDGREREVASAFVAALQDGRLGSWDEVVLGSMSGDGPLPGLLFEELSARGVHASLEQWSSSPYVPLPKTWDEYLAALKPQKRAQLRKSLRAFEAWAGGPPTMTRVRTPSELAEGKRILAALHRERWGDGGVFSSPRFRAFHDRLMPELLAANELDLGWMSVRDQPIAAFYNFRWNGRVQFYQSGRRLDVPDAARVGMAMHAHVIRAAIEDGMHEYDLLAGPSQYKMSLALATRPLVRLRAFRPSLVESARRGAERGASHVRRVWDCAHRELVSRVPPRLASLLGRGNGALADSARHISTADR